MSVQLLEETGIISLYSDGQFTFNLSSILGALQKQRVCGDASTYVSYESAIEILIADNSTWADGLIASIVNNCNSLSYRIGAMKI